MPPDEAPVDERQDQPQTDEAHREEGDQGAAVEESERFTDFDLSTLPEEARGAAEAAEKRMQADYTRKTQATAAELREAQEAQEILDALDDPERAPQVLRALGWELEDEEDEGYDEYDEADPNARIDQLEYERAHDHELALLQEQEDEDADYVVEQIEGLENKHGIEFSTKDIRDLYRDAVENPNQQGFPDVEGAYAFLEESLAHHKQRWAKQPPSSARRLSPGTPGSRTVDLDKESGQDRRQRMADAAAAARAQE